MANDAFELLLERIRTGEHPDYGTISWDGTSRQITVTVQFEGNGEMEPDAVIRERALRYLEGLTAEERAAAEVDVVFREKKPVRAVLRAQTGQLSAKRLRELSKRAGL